MAASDLITFTPEDLAHRDFSNWLSGFTDGEGCFMLCNHFEPGRRAVPTGRFVIKVRQDDCDIVYAIHSYFGCGRLQENQQGKIGRPTITYSIRTAIDLYSVIVPHFDQFPLRAKKRRDYLIWREGVLMLKDIRSRKTRGTPGRRGIEPRWTDAEIAHFDSLVAALKSQRTYKANPIAIPKPLPAVQAQPLLFD